MLLPLFACLFLFAVTVLGLAWPLVARLALDPAEKICACVLLSLLAIYLFAFATFVAGLPPAVHWALPLLAVAGLLLRRSEFVATVRDTDARNLLAGQSLVAAWCVGWLFFIASYSGGGWAGDWFEHWERARFFVERLPLDTKFLGSYALPARPPLANLVTGAFLALTSVSYAHYQVITALLNALAFLPAALLARRFGGPRAIAILAALLLVSPSFVENATFAWTKLITVASVLGGLYFFLRARDADAPPAAAPLCAAALAAGILTHYSAAPFTLLLALAWLLWPPRFRPSVFALSALLLLTWFGWSFFAYGVHTTLLSNSSVTSHDAQHGNQFLKIALNLRDTVVPHFLRSVDPALIAQRSPWGAWRDCFFQLYQVNLLFLFGSVGWLVLPVELLRRWRATAARSRAFWLLFAGGGIFLGVAVHGARDTWGLAHICLQTIMVLGLVVLAAGWSQLARGWRLALIAGATIDFFLGIALQFGAQSYLLDRWLAPGRDSADILTSYNEVALLNLGGKIRNHLAFFTDVFPLPTALVLALLAAVLMLALVRARRIPSAP